VEYGIASLAARSKTQQLPDQPKQHRLGRTGDVFSISLKQSSGKWEQLAQVSVAPSWKSEINASSSLRLARSITNVNI